MQCLFINYWNSDFKYSQSLNYS